MPKPRRGDSKNQLCVAPTGLVYILAWYHRANALGYSLSPLRGFGRSLLPTDRLELAPVDDVDAQKDEEAPAYLVDRERLGQEGHSQESREHRLGEESNGGEGRGEMAERVVDGEPAEHVR